MLVERKGTTQQGVEGKFFHFQKTSLVGGRGTCYNPFFLMSTLITLEEIYAPVAGRLHRVPQTILDILATPNELASDVIRYFFSGQGKLLRPALTLLGAEVKAESVFDEKEEVRLLELAASFEIFHAATLIHDDIIDSAYIRRHLPTINTKWGPELAVLVGDYLHDKAISVIFRSGDARIIMRFLETASTVCDGEIHELQEKNNFAITEDDYLRIIEKKTASLLAYTAEAGGRLAGATEEEAKALANFGRDFGMAFQIIDDCLDFTGNPNEFGKTLGADFSAGVLTLPIIRLLAAGSESIRTKIFEIFYGYRNKSGFSTLREIVCEQGALHYAVERAREFSERARHHLEIFEPSPSRCSLERLVDYVLERSR